MLCSWQYLSKSTLVVILSIASEPDDVSEDVAQTKAATQNTPITQSAPSSRSPPDSFRQMSMRASTSTTREICLGKNWGDNSASVM